MTITTTTPLAPGDQFHFLRDGFTFAVSADFNSDAVISRRGQTVNVTADLIEAAKDRNGDSWLDLIDNEDAQSERYGSPVIARGTGDHLTPWVAGSVEADLAREQAQQEAFALPSEQERQAALAKVRETFGTPATSRTLNNIKGDR